jgi:hypothetical protein
MGTLDNRKAIENELAIINDPLTAEERPVIVELIGLLHAANSVDEFFNLHTKLLVRYLARQRAREELEAQRTGIRDRIRDLAAQSPTPVDAIRREQETLVRMDRAARVQVALSAHTRAIADGLVWKALRYDRAAITILGDGTRVDRLADDGVGLQAELDELAALWDQERAFTIHNDLATILRHGDLTTIRPGKRSVEIREVKATATPGANTRQSLRISTATTLINDGRIVEPQNGRTQRLHRLPLELHTFVAELAEVITECQAEGYAQRPLGSMQHLTVIDYRAWAGRENELGARDAETRSQLGWGPEHKTFEWLASLRRMRDRRASYGSLAPLPIFRLEPESIADLMLGRLDMRTMLRGDLLEEAFGAHAIEAEVAFGDDRDDVFLRVSRGPTSLVIPPSLRERMLFELMTPDSVIELVAGTLDLLNADAALAQDILPSIDESESWA